MAQAGGRFDYRRSWATSTPTADPGEDPTRLIESSNLQQPGSKEATLHTLMFRPISFSIPVAEPKVEVRTEDSVRHGMRDGRPHSRMFR